MKSQTHHFCEFGPFRMDLDERVLLREGRPVPLTPKAFDCLFVLVENSGHIVEKNELMQKVWPDTFVEEVNLARHVSTLRKVLGDSSDDRVYIETIAKRGYRFAASVRDSQEASTRLIVEEHTKSDIFIEEEEERYDLREVPNSSVSTASPASIGFAESWPLLASTVTKAAPSVKWRRAVHLAIVGALVVAAAFFLFKYSIKPVVPFQNIRMAKLTNTGKASDAVISPDGKYVAYVLSDSGRRSIWVRQVATSSNIQLTPFTEDWCGGVSFSPEGNYVYYGRDDRKNPSGFYQVPVLGGPSKKLTEVVSSPVTFSPDGSRFAFIRRYPSQGETALIISNADGTGEQKIATRRKPNFFGVNPSKPAWSPDGKIIACSVGTDTQPGYRMKVVEVRLEDGKEKTISSHDWRWIRALAWLSDGSGLVMTGLEYQERIIGSGNNFQIWHLSYPGGESRKITNDSNDYVEISVTADSNTLVTTQEHASHKIWIAPDGDANRAKQITSEESMYFGLSWMPGQKLAYASTTTGNPDIWIMDADGNNQKQLTTNARANASPSVSPDGRYIVFYSTRAGTHIWRIDSDGGNPKQLTNGLGEFFPQCSPDGKWVVYYSSPSTKPTLWKVPINGGEPAQLSDEHSMFPAISPDGKLVAYVYQDERANPKRGLAVISFEGGHPINRFTLPATAKLFIRWTLDGRALAYIDTRDGISNIWSQPLEGGPPRQLTDFKSDQMFSFDWSHDGEQLACVRGVITNDIVLVSNLR